jgi:hypothetical protein
MALEKNLANCTPREFLIQTNRIRKSAEKWLKATDIMGIRKNVPKLDIPKDATAEETSEIMEKHREKVKEAAKKNFSAILDSVLEKHPEETLELLALACFVDPKNVDDHKMAEYLTNVSEVVNDEAVLSFFTSLTRLVQSDILSA